MRVESENASSELGPTAKSQVAAGGGAAVEEMGEDSRQARPSGCRINEAWGSMGAVVNAVLRVRSG